MLSSVCEEYLLGLKAKKGDATCIPVNFIIGFCHLFFSFQFIQWNIHKIGLKVSEYDLPREATGPFILSGYSGYKQVQFPRGRLFAFDSEGNYMLTCSSTGGVIFKVSLRSGGEYS